MKTLSWLRRGLVLATALLLTACASMYVDSGTPDVESSQYRKPEPRHPVQVLFEFQTKGVANARATSFLKAKALQAVSASGVFTEVAEGPVSGGALLSITLNNVPITDNAFTKGFVTGLTFGLAGSQVTDGYVCTVQYTSTNGAPPITAQARHALHTTVGASAAPGNAVKAANAEEGVSIMTRQVVSNALLNLSKEAAFQ